jgi:hypothetical protein
LRTPGDADPDGGAGNVESIADNSGLLVADYDLDVDWPGKNGAQLSQNCHRENSGNETIVLTQE